MPSTESDWQDERAPVHLALEDEINRHAPKEVVLSCKWFEIILAVALHGQHHCTESTW